MKQQLKKIKYLYEPYKYLKEKVRIFGLNVYPTYDSKKMYKVTQGKEINLKNPQNFNEKLMWLKLNTYYKNPLVTMCADKYRVREYLKEKKCEEILNDLLYSWDSVDEINWDELPNQFVIKCNHGCGYNIVCDDKSKLNIEEAKLKINKWMKEDFWKIYGEVNYKYINKKIICEKYLDTSAGFLPNDYKVYCFNGEPKLMLVCTERSKKLKLGFFDLNWNLMDIGAEKGDPSIEKPKSFNEMIEYSKKLAEGFPFVRVDFYEFNGKPVFGEMTFSPAGCVATYYNEKGLNLLGEMLDISEELDK